MKAQGEDWAVDIRKPDINDQEIGPNAPLDKLDGLGGAGNADAFPAGVIQVPAEHMAHGWLVIDQKNKWHRR